MDDERRLDDLEAKVGQLVRERKRLAWRSRWAAVGAAVAVTLGGSRATGTAGPDSDWDFGLYYRGRIEAEHVRALGLAEMTELNLDLDQVTPFLQTTIFFPAGLMSLYA